MVPVLEIQGICKNFGGIVACNDSEFEVAEGTIKGLIGPNGAGKTTIFNLITGVYKPNKGKIIFLGEEIGGKSPNYIVGKGVARTFQNIRLFRNLSVLENVITALDFHNSKYSLPSALLRIPSVRKNEKQLIHQGMEYLQVVGLDNWHQNRADSLPYGLQRKLEIARALALKPKLLLLDEPAAGMNPEETIELAELIKFVKEKFQLTVLLIEHHMDLVMDICDEIVVMNFGEKLAEGTPYQIQNNPSVLKAYLGEGYKHAQG